MAPQSDKRDAGSQSPASLPLFVGLALVQGLKEAFSEGVEMETGCNAALGPWTWHRSCWMSSFLGRLFTYLPT